LEGPQGAQHRQEGVGQLGQHALLVLDRDDDGKQVVAHVQSLRGRLQRSRYTAAMPARSTWLRRALIVTAEGAVVAVAAVVLSILVLGLGHADLHLPLSYAGDGNFHSMLTKSIIEH